MWLLSLWGFGACRYLHDKLRFTENGLRKKKLVVFSVLEVLLTVLYREVTPLSIWFYLTLLDNDVSLHYLVELVVASSMSQRLSKMESERKSY